MGLAPQDPGLSALLKLGAATAGAAGTQRQPAPHGTTHLSPVWASQLKNVSEAAVRQLNVEIFSARLVRVYDSTDRDAALFELESSQGAVNAILSRSGEYTFFWKR